MDINVDRQDTIMSTNVFEAGSRSVALSPPSSSTSSCAERPRAYRAESEPINVASHPELYERLHYMWQQASDLISTHDSSVDHSQPAVGMEMAPPVGIQALEPAWQRGSIVDTHIFKLLYQSPKSITHFAATKQELPFLDTVNNQEFLGWVAMNEPGVEVDYNDVRCLLSRLSQEATLRERSPNIFSFFNRLLRAHDMFVLRCARFLSYDLWMNMIDSYYGTQGDVGLLALFPVTAPAAFQDYVATSIKAMSEPALENRRRNWSETRDQWLDAERVVVSIKSGKEFHRRYDQLHKLIKIFADPFEERTRRHRAIRALQTDRRAERRRMIKTARIRAWQDQIGPSDSDMLLDDISHIDAPGVEMEVKYGQSSRQSDTTDEPQKLSNQMQQMKLDNLVVVVSTKLA